MRTSLTRLELVELHTALNSTDLKVKPLSAENFLSLIKLKNKLKNEIKLVSEAEQTLSKESGFEMENGSVSAPNERLPELREFAKKMKEFQAAYVLTDVKLNFIPEKELTEYVKQQDTSVAAVLFDYLLKED